MRARLGIGFLLVVLWGVAAVAPALAAKTGGSLLRSCQIAVRGLETGARGMTSADGYHIGYCFGMLQGVQESIAAHGTQYQETLFCAPQEVDRKELLHTFVTFLESNPVAQGLPSVAAVILAFQSAYPCR